ncbi:MAG: hypothetical protein BWX46_00541 [Candidatus Cloacimonetes bacterium ADurb.Bin003]|nr:MAG: hypothetical protein BWX46_00541 [Candidatus Cloacimonetes bacterium ADurb.Bin003]
MASTALLKTMDLRSREPSIRTFSAPIFCSNSAQAICPLTLAGPVISVSRYFSLFTIQSSLLPLWKEVLVRMLIPEPCCNRVLASVQKKQPSGIFTLGLGILNKVSSVSPSRPVLKIPHGKGYFARI